MLIMSSICLLDYEALEVHVRDLSYQLEGRANLPVSEIYGSRGTADNPYEGTDPGISALMIIGGTGHPNLAPPFFCPFADRRVGVY